MKTILLIIVTIYAYVGQIINQPPLPKITVSLRPVHDTVINQYAVMNSLQRYADSQYRATTYKLERLQYLTDKLIAYKKAKKHL